MVTKGVESNDADLGQQREQPRAKHWHGGGGGGGAKLLIAKPYLLKRRTSKVFQKDVYPTSGTRISGEADQQELTQ